MKHKDEIIKHQKDTIDILKKIIDSQVHIMTKLLDKKYLTEKK